MPTCVSSEGARPSQKNCLPQARSHSEAVLRLSGDPNRPSARRRPSVNARSGRWQLAQERSLLPESRTSENSRAPKASLSAVVGLSGGDGGGPAGRSNICRQTPTTSAPCANAAVAPRQASPHSSESIATAPEVARIEGMRGTLMLSLSCFAG